MKKEATVEIYAEESNFAVIRIPSRRYPGLLIQGDSLAGIVGELEEAIRLFDTDRDESLGCLELAINELRWRLKAYREVCSSNSIE
jgi:hypothetical protein